MLWKESTSPISRRHAPPLKAALFKMAAIALAVSFIASVRSGAYAAEQNNRGICGSTDLVFAIDTTYSLAGAISDMKRSMERLTGLLEKVSNNDYRLGLVTFKDTIEVLADLDALPDRETKKDQVTELIRSIRAQGGGAGPEASDEALATVIKGLSAEGRPQSGDFSGNWTGRTRIVVLITDNLPGGFDDKYVEGVDGLNARIAISDAFDRKIRISSIYVPTADYFQTSDPRIEQTMRNYAVGTGGLFARTNSFGWGTADAIARIVEACGYSPIS